MVFYQYVIQINISRPLISVGANSARFTGSLIIIEKKYSDAFIELQQRGTPPKWTGNCSFKNHEKKIRNAVARYNSNKCSFDKYLEEVTRSTMTAALDFNDDGTTKMFLSRCRLEQILTVILLSFSGDIEFADDISDEYDLHEIEFDEDDPLSQDDPDFTVGAVVKTEYDQSEDAIGKIQHFLLLSLILIFATLSVMFARLYYRF